jgi:hypothetical protein
VDLPTGRVAVLPAHDRAIAVTNDEHDS